MFSWLLNNPHPIVKIRTSYMKARKYASPKIKCGKCELRSFDSQWYFPFPGVVVSRSLQVSNSLKICILSPSWGRVAEHMQEGKHTRGRVLSHHDPLLLGLQPVGILGASTSTRFKVTQCPSHRWSLHFQQVSRLSPASLWLGPF